MSLDVGYRRASSLTHASDNPLDPPTRPPSISSQPSGPGSKRHFSSGSRSAAPYQQTVAAGIESKPDEYYQVPPAPSKSPATARYVVDLFSPCRSISCSDDALSL